MCIRDRSKYDLIHVHKQLDNDMVLMNTIEKLSIPVVLDIDDYFHLSDFHPLVITARKEKWHEKILNHVRKANYVTTTTDIYANTLRKYNKEVTVFPNAINPDEKQDVYKRQNIERTTLLRNFLPFFVIPFTSNGGNTMTEKLCTR